MKTGDIVQYAPYPHKDLHKSGITGLIIDGPYLRAEQMKLHVVDVMWSKTRPLGCELGSHISWEYIDELEVLYESR